MPIKSKILATVCVLGIYLIFFMGYWQLPFYLFDPINDFAYEQSLDQFRDVYMLIFSLATAVVAVVFRMWIGVALQLLFTMTLMFDELLLPVVRDNVRVAAYTMPNLLVTSWGFGLIYTILLERLGQRPMKLLTILSLAAIFFLFQMFTFPIILLFSGPR